MLRMLASVPVRVSHRTTNRTRWDNLALWILFGAVFAGCSDNANRVEGQKPGDCSDEADNDLDGAFDCDDPGCSGSPACRVETTPCTEDTDCPRLTPYCNSYAICSRFCDHDAQCEKGEQCADGICTPPDDYPGDQHCDGGNTCEGESGEDRSVQSVEVLALLEFDPRLKFDDRPAHIGIPSFGVYATNSYVRRLPSAGEAASPLPWITQYDLTVLDENDDTVLSSSNGSGEFELPLDQPGNFRFLLEASASDGTRGSSVRTLEVVPTAEVKPEIDFNLVSWVCHDRECGIASGDQQDRFVPGRSIAAYVFAYSGLSNMHPEHYVVSGTLTYSFQTSDGPYSVERPIGEGTSQPFSYEAQIPADAFGDFVVSATVENIFGGKASAEKSVSLELRPGEPELDLDPEEFLYVGFSNQSVNEYPSTVEGYLAYLNDVQGHEMCSSYCGLNSVSLLDIIPADPFSTDIFVADKYRFAVRCNLSTEVENYVGIYSGNIEAASAEFQVFHRLVPGLGFGIQPVDNLGASVSSEEVCDDLYSSWPGSPDGSCLGVLLPDGSSATCSSVAPSEQLSLVCCARDSR